MIPPSDDSVSRRDFFGGVLGASVAATVGDADLAHAIEPGAPPPPAAPDFAHGAAALEPDKIVTSACQFCNSLCGLKVHLKAGRVIDIKGLTEDPVQAGQLCIKGPMMAQLVYNRYRIKTPLKRIGKKGDPNAKFEAISWDEALGMVASKFLELRDAGDAHAIVSRTSGRLPRGVGSLIHRLFVLLGSPNDTDVGPVCNDAGGNALAWTFGMGNFTNGYGISRHQPG
jgi:anaerobic selenocysteine-containing dehydrogenase